MLPKKRLRRAPLPPWRHISSSKNLKICPGVLLNPPCYLAWFSPGCTSGRKPSSSARSGRSRAAAANGRSCSGWCLESKRQPCVQSQRRNNARIIRKQRPKGHRGEDEWGWSVFLPSWLWFHLLLQSQLAITEMHLDVFGNLQTMPLI